MEDLADIDATRQDASASGPGSSATASAIRKQRLPRSPSTRPTTSATRRTESKADDSLQSSILNGFNASELSETGAYDPGLHVPWPPDLDGGLCRLFHQRDKWSQLPISFHETSWRGWLDVRYDPGV